MLYLKRLIKRKDRITKRLKEEYVRNRFEYHLNYSTYLLNAKTLKEVHKSIDIELKRTIYKKGVLKLLFYIAPT